MAAVNEAGRAALVHTGRRGALVFDDAARDLTFVAAAALPLVLISPVVTSILALATFGLVHTFLELRWVLARFRSFLSGRFLLALLVPASAIAVARLVGAPRPVEIVAGFALLGLGVAQGARTGRLSAPAATLAAATLAAALVGSLAATHMYGIVLAHAHNVVTGILLWNWAGDWSHEPVRQRRFRTALVVLFAVLPAAVLSGAFDGLLPDRVTGIVPSTVSPGWASPTATVRLMAVFAFLQLVHYGVWCWLLPRRSDTAPLGGPAGRTARATLAAFAVAAGLLALVFSTDLTTGRTLYTSVATYHAYLEFPVVLLLLGGFRASR